MSSDAATSRQHAPAWSDWQVPASLMFLLPYVVYVVHTLEELPGFADWATRHFGPETTSIFTGYHIPLILLVLGVSIQAVRRGAHGGWVVFATAFQWQFAVNALFHLATWLVLDDYSPGVVTAATVSLPATALFLIWVRRQQRITNRELFAAIVIGTIIAALAIGFLFL